MQMQVIDFAAARKRIDALKEVSIEIDPACVREMPRAKSLLEMLRECTDDVGTFGVREELLHNRK
jgi:hypothetical protein